MHLSEHLEISTNSESFFSTKMAQREGRIMQTAVIFHHKVLAKNNSAQYL